jgi:hypothetical protein
MSGKMPNFLGYNEQLLKVKNARGLAQGQDELELESQI